MWTVKRLDTLSFYRHVMAAAEAAGYLGVVFLLGRSAEIKNVQHELAGEWESFHALTGSAIGFVCPVPGQRATVSDAGTRTQFQSSDLLLSFAESDRLNRFASAFHDAALADDPHLFSRLGERSGSTKRSAEAEWTRSASIAAELFGVPEKSLPAVVVFDVSRRSGMVVPVSGSATLPGTLKAILEEISPDLAAYRTLRDERDELQHEVNRAEDAEAAYQRWQEYQEFAEQAGSLLAHWPQTKEISHVEWPASVEQLERRLEDVSSLAPSQVTEVCSALGRIRERKVGDPELAGRLAAILQLLLDNRVRLKPGLPSLLRQVIQSLDPRYSQAPVRQVPVPPAEETIKSWKIRIDQVSAELTGLSRRKGIVKVLKPAVVSALSRLRGQQARLTRLSQQNGWAMSVLSYGRGSGWTKAHTMWTVIGVLIAAIVTYLATR